MLLDEFREHPVRTAAAAAMSLLLVAALALAVFGRPGGPSVQRVATGPGAEPAVVASAAVAWALDARNMLSVDYESGLRDVGWSTSAAAEMVVAASSEDARSMIAAAGGELAVKGGTGMARTLIAAASTDAVSGESATVRLWIVSLVVSTSSSAPVNLSVWQSATVRLERDAETWLVVGYDNVAGPTPGPSPAAPAAARELIHFVRGMP